MALAGTAFVDNMPSQTVRLPAVNQTRAVAAALLLIGLVVPTELSIYPGGVAVTPGRIGLFMLLPAALAAFFAKGRRLIAADFFLLATVVWMMGAASYVSGFGALTGASGAESLELFAGYLIARALFVTPVALDSLIRMMRLFGIIAIAVAVADFAARHLVLHDALAAMLGVKPAATPVFRSDMLRATSTFEHPILFGAFCSLLAAIMLYWETGGLRRLLLVGICFAGALISLTSAALLSTFLVLAIYGYDRLLIGYAWRWKAVMAALVLFLAAVYAATNAPLGWVITHLTFDPETGYFRYLIWQAAIIYIDQAPIVGHAYNLLNNDILDHTVDSVWLVTALRYGVPAVALLFLANVAAIMPSRADRRQFPDPRQATLRTGFTITLVMFMFLGLTVHFWNFMWIFWGVCLGVRGSLQEVSWRGERQTDLLESAKPFARGEGRALAAAMRR